ncbi:MAG: metalloregulator ArsR/SmtB family transcription factor [Phycisphaerales bacterium]|nr:metalloregulator ArsR/SmtB family transcription factor [Phycisphaerales bacterium]
MGTEKLFKAMADEQRHAIVQLTARQEMSVSELVACLRQPQSSVSRHLKVLREAGLVRDRRDGSAIMYSAATDAGGTGNGTALASRMVEWAMEQELPRAVQERLDRVLGERQNRSDDFFVRVGHRWDQLRIEAFGRWFQFEALASLLPVEWTVADIGTGTGFLLPLLSRSFANVIAVDPVAAMLDVARKRCAVEKTDNVTFRRGDLGRLPIADGRVDLATAMLVLHHVPSPEEALRELFRIIRPGGKLLIVEQCAHRLESFHERMQDRWWGFEPAQIETWTAAAGFSRVQAFPLPTDAEGGIAVDAPELFTLTAERPE